MNIGTICYATRSGLGYLAKQFYDNGIINRIYVLDHPRYEANREWYREEHRFGRFTADAFLKGLDAILIFENAFTQWRLVDLAKKRGIKLIIIPMYEWTPNPLPINPDLVLCPSKLDIYYFKHYNYEFIHIPAPDLPWLERTHAKLFVHNAGHGQVGYAKGTPEVLEAMRYTESDARLLVRGQTGEKRIADVFREYIGMENVDFEYGDKPYEELFSTGDVYINAERYNGLSLPLQEAYSSGMLVMTTDRFPANSWLPKEPLIPYSKIGKHTLNHTEFDIVTVDPRTIAKKIDEWYGKPILEYSQRGQRWAEEHSWDRMRPQYLDLIRSVVGK